MANKIETQLTLDDSQAVAAITGFGKVATSQLGKVEQAASFLEGTIKLLGVAFVGNKLLQGLESVVKSAEESQTAIAGLNTALSLAGDFSASASVSFQEYATQLEEVTQFSDEAILSSVALAKQFGVTNAQAKALTTAAADLAAATGISLTDATRQLGQTLDGTAERGLKQAIPALQGIGENALKAGAAIQIVGDRFKGAAEAAGSTFQGSLSKLGNEFDNVKESIGGLVINNKLVLDSIKFITDAFINLNKYLTKNSEAILDVSKSITVGLVNSFGVLAQVVKVVVEFLGAAYVTVNDIAQSILAIPNAFKAVVDAITGGSLSQLKQVDNSVKEAQASARSGRDKILASIDSVTQKTADYSVALDKLSAKQITNIKSLESTIRNSKKNLPALIGDNAAKVFSDLIKSPFSVFSKEFRANIEKFSKVGLTVASGLTASLAAALGKGKEGARGLLAGGAGVGVTALTGSKEAGAAATEVFNVLSQGPEKVRDMIKEFADGIPQLVLNVINSLPLIVDLIPQIIQKLIDNLPQIVGALANAIPQVAIKLANMMPFVAVKLVGSLVSQAPNILKAFVDEFLKIPEKFLKELIDGIKGAFEGVANPIKGIVGGGPIGGAISGGVVGGPVGSLVGGIAGGIGDVFGFKEAVSTPQQPSGDQTQNLTVVMRVGEKDLASTILKLNRNGFRLA